MKLDNKIILIAPLDWGLGHAGRCIPLIQGLLEKRCKLIIGASGSSLEMLKLEFPNLEFVELPSYKIHFWRNSVIGPILFNIPKISKTIKREKLICSELVKKFKLDVIISDNRYGVYSPDVVSIMITHQLNILLPAKLNIFGVFVNLVNRLLLRKFDEIWIPDTENHELSGRLSEHKNIHPNIKYIGWLSRFKKLEPIKEKDEIFAWVSGPEPHRSRFADLLKQQLLKIDLPTTLVLGQPNLDCFEEIGNLKIVNHLNSSDFQFKLQEAKYIICRSGYSSLMDLMELGKSALLIPTPRQTEQEYLAEHLKNHPQFLIQKQEEMDLESYIKTH